MYNLAMEDKVPVYNPDTEDFTVTYDINGDARPVPFTIHSREIEYFEPVIAKHFRKHLAVHILNKRGVKTNWQDDLEAIRKEMEVIL